MEISQNYLEFGENTTEISVSGHSESSDGHMSKLVLLCIFSPLSFVCVFQNFRVISIVVTMPPRKRRAGDILIAHLSLVYMLLTFIAGDYILYKFFNVNLVEKSEVSCAMKSYIRNVVISVPPINVAAVNYEKTQGLRKDYHGGKFLIGRCISIMWILAVVLNLPNIFTVKFTVMEYENISKCKENLLFNNEWITTSYEFLKLIVFNAMPIGYVIQTLVLIRSVIYKYIIYTKTELTEEIKRKRYKVKLVLANAIVFAFFWLPQGLLTFGYKIYCRINLNGKQSGPNRNMKPGDDVTSAIFYALIVAVFFTYVAVSPLIHLHLNTHLSDTKWYQFSFQRIEINKATGIRNGTNKKAGDSGQRGRLQARNRNPSNEDLQNEENIVLHDLKISAVSNEIYATSIISRISTFQNSTTLMETPSEILDNAEIFV